VLTLEVQALRLLEERFNPRWYLFTVTGASLAHTWRGTWGAAVEEAEKALRLGTETADDGIFAFAAFVLSHAYTAKGDPERGLSYGALAVERAPTLGEKVWSQSFLAWAYCRSGRAREGIALLEPAVTMQRAGRFIWSEVCALLLGEAYWMAGDHDRAVRTLEEVLEIAGRCGMRYLVGSAHRLLAEVAMTTGAGPAADHFEASIATLEAIKAENELALACAGHGRWHARSGDKTAARDSLTRALTIFERLGTRGEPERVRAELARS
jgi:tetratricopeptide (TPR) repeat protein